jgi:hypothetical protein
MGWRDEMRVLRDMDKGIWRSGEWTGDERSESDEGGLCMEKG